MDKRMLSLLLILIIIFIGFNLATENNVLTIMDTSDKYTTADVKSALDGLKDGLKQWKEHEDLSLRFTEFDADYSDEKTAEYLETHDADESNVIVIKAKVRVSRDHEGAFNPGETYNWAFTLVRADEDAPWTLEEWGEQ